MSTPDLDLSYLLEPVPVPEDGPDRIRRRARQRRRRHAAFATGAMGVTVALFVGLLVRTDDVSRVRTLSPSPMTAVVPPDPRPTVMPSSPKLTATTGARLLLVGKGTGTMQTLDVDARRLERLPLPVPGGGSRLREVIRRAGGYVIVVAQGDDSYESNPVRGVYFVDDDLHFPPTHLGDGTDVLPSLDTDRVWIVEQRRDDVGFPLESTIVEVDMSGAITTPSQAIPCCREPLADVHGGILTQTKSQSVQVWSLRHQVVRRVVATHAEYVATDGDVVAWVRDDDDMAGIGQLHLTDMRTGETRGVMGDDVSAGPDTLGASWTDVGSYAYGEGKFSTDGAWLAVYLPGDGASTQVGLVDVEAAFGRVLPDSSIASGPLAWSGTDHWLFFSIGFDHGSGSLKAARAEDMQTHRVDVKLDWNEPFDVVPLDPVPSPEDAPHD